MDDLSPEARALVQRLGLAPHPEGGWFRETWRSPGRVQTPRGERSAMTVIDYLLPAGAFSAFHRVHSEEAWHHVAGGPLELQVLTPDGLHQVHRVGPLAHHDARSHVVVPAGAWQAARPLGGEYALVSCTVAPGFEFEDFEMAERHVLVALRPDLEAAISELCLPRR
jgi:predicted cupin superfamily sugar epimerase